MENVKLIAHRGLSGLAPENSITAFELVTKDIYYGIEADIHATSDGKFVIFHDFTLNRMVNVDKNITKCNFDELLELKLTDGNNIEKYQNEKIPTLEEYIDICVKKNLEAIAEIKSVQNLEQLDEIITIIKKKHHYSKTTIISFNLEYLIYLRNKYQDLKIQYLVSEINEGVLNACVKYRFDLDSNHAALTKEVVQLFKKNNVLVNAWTVDLEKRAKELIKMGVDFITTNILE